MKKLLLVLLAVAACKTPAADPVTPRPPDTVANPEQPPTAPAKAEQPPPKTSGATPKLLAAIERTPCFGHCPIYRAEVFEDGSLVFDGRRFTAVLGRQEAILTEERLRALVARLEQADFAKWKPSYEHRDMTDMPSAIVTFREKTIRHYHGDRSAPEALTALEDELDALFGIQPWVREKSSEQ